MGKKEEWINRRMKSGLKDEKEQGKKKCSGMEQQWKTIV